MEKKDGLVKYDYSHQNYNSLLFGQESNFFLYQPWDRIAKVKTYEGSDLSLKLEKLPKNNTA